MNANIIGSDLLSRGFVATENGKFEYAHGSIANYCKCTICLGYTLWGDIANEYFYHVRHESFAESGQPEIDHHTVIEQYVAASKIIDYVKANNILTREEREEKRREFRAKLAR